MGFLSQDAVKARKPFSLPLKEGFSETTEERIRTRRFRLRVRSLGRLGKPLKILLSLGLIALLSYIAVVQMKHLFFGTSYFEIRAIEVEGLSAIARADLMRFANVAPGQNILTFDRQALQERILRHPWVKECRVGLAGMFTLRIAVVERTPFLYVKSGTAFLEVADDGVILMANGAGDKEIPIVTGLAVEEKQAGDSLADHDGFREAKTWVIGLPAPILAEISEINFTSIHNPYIFLRTGVKLFPRSLEDLRARFGFLRALLDNLRKNNVEPEYLDLRAPNDIVVKPRKPIRTIEGGKREVAGR